MALYGERLMKVEPFGIEPVSLEERHGRAFDQFTLWLGSNLTIADFALGFLPISLGLPWPWVIASILLGNVVGSLLVGAFAAMGPSYGVPQLIIGRYGFGRLGGLLPALLNYVSTIGWFTVNNILGSFGLLVLFPHLQFWQAAIILVVVQGLLAIYGHNLIHAYERVMSIVLAVVFLIATVICLKSGVTLTAYHPTGAPLWPMFAIMVAAAFSYVGSWAPYASDYSRYLQPNEAKGKVAFWAFLGSFIASVWLELVGAAVAVLAGSTHGDAISSLHYVMGGFGTIAVIAIILGGTAADALNLYSNALSAGALQIRLPRAFMAVFASVIGLIFSLLGSGNFESNFENFLLMLGYWMTPWAGILIVDFYIFKNYKHRASDQRDRQAVNASGLISFLVGVLLSTPFMNGPFYEGSVAKALGGADLSFYVGFIVAGLMYYGLSRDKGLQPARA